MKPSKIELFNYDKFVERLLGDEALAQRIGWSVIKDFDHNLEKLKHAQSAADISQVMYYLHGIKGVAANAQCQAVFIQAGKLEEEASSGNEDGCLAGIGHFISLVESTIECLKEHFITPGTMPHSHKLTGKL